MAFIEDRLLDKVAYGFQIGPEFQTRIKTLRNGHERRNRDRSSFRWKGSAPYQAIKPNDFDDLLGAFLTAGGMADSFRFKNWIDYAATGQALGVAPAGSTPIQLVKDYVMFGSVRYRRTITKPVTGTVTVYENDIAKAGTTDTATGIFTPTTAWAAGTDITASFQFDIPVRFDTDWMPMTYAEWEALTGEVPIIEVFGE